MTLPAFTSPHADPWVGELVDLESLSAISPTRTMPTPKPATSRLHQRRSSRCRPLATQRPDRDTVPPLLKSNLGGRIALRVASAVNSRIVLDEGGAEKLLGRGDMLANLGRGLVRARGAVVSAQC